MKLKDIKPIAEWLVFTDHEIGVFQKYFFDYLKTYEKDLNKEECYNLAILANDTQYQMRVLKGRIIGETNLDIVSNNYWIKTVVEFDNLIYFIIQEFIKTFNNLTIEKQYLYKKENPYSYFNTTDEIKDSLKKDLKNIFKQR